MLYSLHFTDFQGIGFMIVKIVPLSLLLTMLVACDSVVEIKVDQVVDKKENVCIFLVKRLMNKNKGGGDFHISDIKHDKKDLTENDFRVAYHSGEESSYMRRHIERKVNIEMVLDHLEFSVESGKGSEVVKYNAGCTYVSYGDNVELISFGADGKVVTNKYFPNFFDDEGGPYDLNSSYLIR